MANIYVSPTGSDTTGDGSYNNPYRHIYYAINQASDGDTIICKSGTYNEENLQGSYPYLRAGLTIKSETGNFEDVIVYADGWTGRNWFWGIESGYSPSLGKVTIRDITIKIGATGDNGKSLFYHYGANTCFDLVNLFVDGQNKSARTMWLRNGSDSKFYKCTFRNIASPDYFIVFGWDYHAYTFNLDLKDCIFENIQTTLIHKGIDHAGNLNNDYNCLYNISNYGNYSLNTHDITSDPLFSSSSSAKIQRTSPCKNAGTTITGYIEDYEGTAPDIGCYELSANIYVSPTGSDTSGDGSQSNPYKHIYKAIQVASDGDTIICKSGTYNEENLQGTYPRLPPGITIKSETGNFEDVIVYLDGWSDYSYAKTFWYNNVGGNPIYIKNLTFKNGILGNYQDSFFTKITQCKVYYINCFIDGLNKYLSIYQQNQNLYMYKTTIRNCLATSDWNRVITVRYSNSYLKDCIFENIDKLCYNTPTEADYNCLYNIADYGNYSLNTHDITSDPKFTSSSSAQIQNDSPCIDAGITITGYVEDYEGTAPDIGAYEVPEPTQQTISSDSIIKGTTQQNINSDGKIINNRSSSTIQSEGVIKRTSQQTITSDTEITSPLTQQQINSDTTIVIRRQEHINSNSFIKYFKDFYARCRVSQSSYKDFNTQFKINQPTPINPTGLSCVDLYTGEAIELTWNDVGNYGYNVYKDVGGSWVKQNETVITDTNYIVGSLTANVSYTFKVTGVNGIDEESSGTIIGGCTPTFNLEELSKAPIYKIYIDGVELQDAILERIELVYGPSFSTATFYLPTRHDTPGIPDANRQEVTIYINNRLVFTGRLVKRTDVYDATSIRVNYEAYSKLWDYTLYTAGRNFNKSEGKYNKKSISVSSVLSGSGCPAGLPGTLYGEVRVADMTRLEIMTDMIRYAGNYKIYTSPSGITSYYKVGNPVTKRTYEIGKHILDYEMTKDISNKITSAKAQVEGTVKHISTRYYWTYEFYPFIYYDPSTNEWTHHDNVSWIRKDKDGNYYIQLTLGAGCSDIRVFALVNEKPEVVKFSDLSVTPGHIVEVSLSIQTNLELDTFTFLSDQIDKLKLNIDPNIPNSFKGLSKWPDGSVGSKRVVLSYRTFKPAFKSINANIDYGSHWTTITIPNIPVVYQPFVLNATSEFILPEGEVERILTPVMLEPWQYLTTIAVVYTWKGTRRLYVTSGIGGSGAHRTITENIDVYGSVNIPSFIPYGDHPKANYNEVLNYLSSRASSYIHYNNRNDYKGKISIIGDETLDLRTQVNGLEVVKITHDFTNGFITHIDLTDEKFYGGETSFPELNNVTVKSRVFKDESTIHKTNADISKVKWLSGILNKYENLQKLEGDSAVYSD